VGDQVVNVPVGTLFALCAELSESIKLEKKLSSLQFKATDE
jgi:hypothetical protein